MTDGSKQGGEESPRSHDRQESGPVVHDDLPDILEVFGSDPLVKGEAPSPSPLELEPGDEASWPTPDRQSSEDVSASRDDDENEDDDVDDDSIWDPMESPRDVADESTGVDSGELSSGTTSPGRSSSPRSSATTVATERRLGEMRDILRLNEDRLGRLEATIQDLSKQTNFLPPKLRGLGKKVDELSTSMGDARLRSLLADVAGLGDLAEGALQSLPPQDQESQGFGLGRFFHAMATRIGQILESYDLQEIPTDVGFDPTVHNAIDVENVDDEALDGRIIDVVRRGYRGEHSVLRYAEVTVGRYTASAKPEPEPVGEPEAEHEAGAAPAAEHDDEHEAYADVDADVDAEPQPATAAPEPDETAAMEMATDGISANYAPFLGASGTAEDSKNLTKRGTRRPTERNETTDDPVDSERGVEPPSA